MKIIIKNEFDISQMRISCRLASELLDYIEQYISAGITTNELDKLCYEYIVNVQNSIPGPLNYQPLGYPPYPKSTCISVNDVVCHGIPGNQILMDGDSLNIDVTIIKNGYYGDSSRMFIVGQGSKQTIDLINTAFQCMWIGIQQIRPGVNIGNIGHAIQQYAESYGYSVVKEYCGHGIGKSFHEAPQVLHYGDIGTGIKLKIGMIFTVEPMINIGSSDIKLMPDKWTVKTKDHSLSAQWEHTVLVTETGYEVLTLS